MKIYVVIECGGYFDLAFREVTLVTESEKDAEIAAKNPKIIDEYDQKTDTTYRHGRMVLF